MMVLFELSLLVILVIGLNYLFLKKNFNFSKSFTSLLYFPVSFSPDQCDKQKLGHFPKCEIRYGKYFLDVMFKLQNSLVRLIICVNNLEKIEKKIFYIYIIEFDISSTLDFDINSILNYNN